MDQQHNNFSALNTRLVQDQDVRQRLIHKFLNNEVSYDDYISERLQSGDTWHVNEGRNFLIIVLSSLAALLAFLLILTCVATFSKRCCSNRRCLT